jgi:hypothetical protein
MLSIIKLILFHILFSLRGIVLGISRLLAFSSLVVFMLTFYIYQLSAIPFVAKAMLLTVGIFFTLVFWLYDYLIFYLKPKMIDIMLTK